MIKINNIALWMLDLYLERITKKSFHSLNLFGDVPQIAKSTPILLLPNHSSWWDGFLVQRLNKQYFERNLYILILEETIKKYPFFAKVGAFPINHKNPKSIIQSIRNSIEILESPTSPLLNIYPQGVLTADFVRPIIFKNGISKIVNNCKTPIAVVALSMMVEMLSERKPYVFFKFGKTRILETIDAQLINEMEREIESGLDFIKNEIANGNFGNAFFGSNRGA